MAAKEILDHDKARSHPCHLWFLSCRIQLKANAPPRFPPRTGQRDLLTDYRSLPSTPRRTEAMRRWADFSVSACQRFPLPGPPSRRCPEAHRRGQPLHSEAGNAKNAPESTICGVPRKRSTTTGSGPWLAPNFLFQKPPSQGRPDQSTVWPKPAWNGSAWKTTTTDRNCRTRKACCTAVASLLQHQGAKAQSRGGTLF